MKGLETKAVKKFDLLQKTGDGRKRFEMEIPLAFLSSQQPQLLSFFFVSVSLSFFFAFLFLILACF